MLSVATSNPATRNTRRSPCSACGHRTKVSVGRVDYGKATCPYCRYREPLIEVGRRTGEAPVWREFAVEVLGRPDGGRPVPMHERLFFKTNNHSKDRYKAAIAAYRRRAKSHASTLPDIEISKVGRADTRLVDYGYRCWSELFNPRQLLHLSLSAEAIQKYDEPERLALAMAYSDHLTTNCMLTSYAAGWRRLTPLFSVRAFRHVPRPVELNPWMDGTGRGSFPNTVRKLMRARGFARSPKEPILEGGFRDVAAVGNDTAHHTTYGTARDLSFIPAGSVDLVLTDPPYFDNIPYSELAEFFLPWLRLLDVVSDRRDVESIRLQSLVARRGDPESIERYTIGLREAFDEIGRVLKTKGIFIFSYRHTEPAAWLALARAINPCQFSAVRVLPAPGEAGVGLHNHEGTGLWDAVFVLRGETRSGTPSGQSIEIPRSSIVAAATAAEGWLRSLGSAPIPFTEVDRVTMHRAGLVVAAVKSSTRCRASGWEKLERALQDSS